jgi:AcrR family transcriptional regulator
VTNSERAAEEAVRGVRLSRSARRQQLLAAAQRVFASQGYHAAAMDEIAEQAGVSKPVLYQHFPGKLELYLALLDTHTKHLLARVRAALESTDDNKQRVRAGIAAYFDFVEGCDSEHEGAFRLVFESDLRQEPAVRERVEASLQECAGAISEVIAADTGVAASDAHLLGVALAGMAEVSARYWLTGSDHISKARAVDLLATLAWRGIAEFPRVP